MGKIDFGKAFSRGWEIFNGNMVNLMIGFFLTSIISITIILAPIMYAGLYFMVLKAARGGKVEVGDVFHGFSAFGRYFVGGLLALGVGILGILACGIGIIPVSGILLFFFPLMVDKGLSAGEAFGRSWNFFKSDWLMAILLAIVSGLVSQAGAYVLWVGIFFTGPFATAITIAAYLDVFEGGAPQAAPVAPPADPTVPPPPPPIEP
jgi:membrane-anchored glycerophosphoryl diester phosphodiesterase (GDPDase)